MDPNFLGSRMQDYGSQILDPGAQIRGVPGGVQDPVRIRFGPAQDPAQDPVLAKNTEDRSDGIQSAGGAPVPPRERLGNPFFTTTRTLQLNRC